MDENGASEPSKPKYSIRQLQGKENREWGHEAEGLAAEYFLTNGYMIRERNWRLNKYEIDLILEKERTIIFVEVKARRGDRQDPVDAVDMRKRKKLVQGADIYLRNQPYRYEYRFDIVSFTGTRDNYVMKHYPDAFLPAVNGYSVKKT